jgi:hypothetical protein
MRQFLIVLLAAVLASVIGCCNPVRRDGPCEQDRARAERLEEAHRHE